MHAVNFVAKLGRDMFVEGSETEVDVAGAVMEARIDIDFVDGGVAFDVAVEMFDGAGIAGVEEYAVAGHEDDAVGGQVFAVIGEQIVHGAEFAEDAVDFAGRENVVETVAIASYKDGLERFEVFHGGRAYDMELDVAFQCAVENEVAEAADVVAVGMG